MAGHKRSSIGKWAGAAVACMLVVGLGNTVAGVVASDDAGSHMLVSTGGAQQSSTALTAAFGVAQEVAEDAVVGKETAEAIVRAKAKAATEGDGDVQSASGAETQAPTRLQDAAEVQVQAQNQPEAATPTVTPVPEPQPAQNGATSSGASSATVSEGPAFPAASVSGMVYIAASGNGRNYHSTPTCSNMKDAISLSVGDAQAQGKTACSKCF